MAPAREVPCAHCDGAGKVTLAAEVETVEAYYFGCWHDKGHYWVPLQAGSGSRYEVDRRVPEPLRNGRIDGRFCPGASEDPRDPYKRTRPEEPGEARLTHVDGWTVLSWWDRTIDGRGASNSSIVAKGTLDFTTMLEIGKARAAHVMARQNPAVRLVEERK